MEETVYFYALYGQYIKHGPMWVEMLARTSAKG